MATATIERNDPAHQQRVEAHAARIQAEFHSRADAKEMSKADIQNVRPLKLTEQELLIRRLELCNPKLARELLAADEALWGDGWESTDERWTLTPHQLRRERETARKGVSS